MELNNLYEKPFSAAQFLMALKLSGEINNFPKSFLMELRKKPSARFYNIIDVYGSDIPPYKVSCGVFTLDYLSPVLKKSLDIVIQIETDKEKEELTNKYYKILTEKESSNKKPLNKCSKNSRRNGRRKHRHHL